MAGRTTVPQQVSAEVTEEVTEEVVKTPEAPAFEELFIPKGADNDDPNLFVGINGVNYILPRGKTSRVPAHVAAEIKRSYLADQVLDKRVQTLLEKANEPQ